MSIQIGFHAEDKTIDDILFTSKRFRIPRYQRPYSWGNDQVSDFWNDIRQKDSSFFIGSFVFNLQYVDREGCIEIIDGQQRALTITIFMAVLREIFKDMGEKDNAKRIQTKCLAFEDRRGKETYKIESGESINDYLIKHVQDYDSLPFPEKGSKEEMLIKKNFEYFKQEIIRERDQRQDKTKKIDYLYELWDIVAKLKVIWIEIANDNEAYEIFETVNARGADLTVADLLKNLICKNIQANEKGIDIAKQKWTKIEDNIADTDIDLSKFIRHYWLSKYSFVGEKGLFKQIKREISNYQDFLDEILEGSEWYKKIMVGKREDWMEVDGGVKIHQSLMGIRAMNAIQCNALFLCLLRNIDKIGINLASYFKIIEKFTFLYSGVCKLQANMVEKLYAKTAQAIQGQIESSEKKHIIKNVQRQLSEMIDEFKENVPSKAVFDESFNDIQYKASEKSRIFIKYVLSTINKCIAGAEMDLDFDVVNIEHILPQKPSAEWGLRRSDIKSYVDMLGNITLVAKQYNSEAGNKSAQIKAGILSKSQIAITKEIAKQLVDNDYQWTKDDILSRHKGLARIAYDEVWKI